MILLTVSGYRRERVVMSGSYVPVASESVGTSVPWCARLDVSTIARVMAAMFGAPMSRMFISTAAAA